MSDDDQARQRLAMWWQRLDPTAKRMFEEIRAEQPELAIRVIGGGKLTAPDPGTTLETYFVLPESFPSFDPSFTASNVVIEPGYPEPGTAFTVTYDVGNYGADARGERRDEVRIVDPDRKEVAAQQLAGMALPQSASEGMQATFDKGVPEGEYGVEVWINLDGGEFGAPANEHGSQAYDGVSLRVGAYATEAGPATAESALINDAMRLPDEGAALVASAGAPQWFIETAQAFGRRATAVLSAATGAFPQWEGGEETLKMCQVASDELDRMSPDYFDYANWEGDAVQEIAIAAHQAALPFGSLALNAQMIATNGPGLAGAVQAIPYRLRWMMRR
jgi:hypothetical protein